MKCTGKRRPLVSVYAFTVYWCLLLMGFQVLRRKFMPDELGSAKAGSALLIQTESRCPSLLLPKGINLSQKSWDCSDFTLSVPCPESSGVNTLHKFTVDQLESCTESTYVAFKHAGPSYPPILSSPMWSAVTEVSKDIWVELEYSAPMSHWWLDHSLCGNQTCVLFICPPPHCHVPPLSHPVMEAVACLVSACKNQRPWSSFDSKGLQLLWDFSSLFLYTGQEHRKPHFIFHLSPFLLPFPLFFLPSLLIHHKETSTLFSEIGRSPFFSCCSFPNNLDLGKAGLFKITILGQAWGQVKNNRKTKWQNYIGDVLSSPGTVLKLACSSHVCSGEKSQSIEVVIETYSFLVSETHSETT